MAVTGIPLTKKWSNILPSSTLPLSSNSNCHIRVKTKELKQLRPWKHVLQKKTALNTWCQCTKHKVRHNLFQLDGTLNNTMTPSGHQTRWSYDVLYSIIQDIGIDADRPADHPSSGWKGSFPKTTDEAGNKHLMVRTTWSLFVFGRSRFPFRMNPRIWLVS